MIVMKFGGTSVDGPRKIEDVAGLVASTRSAETEKVVVLSAMAGVTDSLLALARDAAAGRAARWNDAAEALAERHRDTAGALTRDAREREAILRYIDARFAELDLFLRSLDVMGELTPQAIDRIAGTGERLSTRLLALALRERGIAAEAIDADSGVIVTDSRFGDARPDRTATRLGAGAGLGPLLKRGVVPVVTGFLGATPAGETTTLGRSGSDYSAALIGAALDADEVWIWSDVDGILSADPKIVPEARVLRHLSYASAAEMAACGADVLHPNTIRPLVPGSVPLRLKNTFNPGHAGTLVSSCHCDHVPAIISADRLALVTIRADADSWSQDRIATVLHRLAHAGVNVLLLLQSTWHHGVSLLIGAADGEETMAAASMPNHEVSIRPRVATISVFGHGVVLPAMAALGETGTDVLAVLQANADSGVVVVVPEDDMAPAVRHFHDRIARTVGHAEVVSPGVSLYEN